VRQAAARRSHTTAPYAILKLQHAVPALFGGMKHTIQYEATDIHEHPVGLVVALITNAFRICQLKRL
jgi:hypothetical protein